MRWVLVFAGLLSTCSVFGCDEKAADPDQGKGKPTGSSPEADEPSPNARILPEPLEGGVPSALEDAADEKLLSVAVEPREEAQPFPLNQALPDDTLKRGPGAGLEMEFQVAWPEGRKSVTVGKQTFETWPRLRIQLLREIPSRPARMRWILEGRAFPFPENTELRARADRIGNVLIWPNHRSYRVAPTGSLHALFADRRVDRMPFVEPEKVEKGEGSRLGKPTKLSTLMSPVGTAKIEFIEESDLPYASEMLCAAFLEILRLRPTKELCPRFHLPIHFEIEWPNEESVVFSVLSWGTAGNFELDDFRMPPDLPIHKRGELPPFEDHFLDDAVMKALLPIAAERAEPLPAPAPEPPAPGIQPETPVPTPEGPPRNQIVVENRLSRPLVVFVNKVPYVWLTPGSREELYVSSPDVRVAARDFLGEMVFAERTLLAPAQLHFGETGDEESAAGGFVQ